VCPRHGRACTHAHTTSVAGPPLAQTHTCTCTCLPYRARACPRTLPVNLLSSSLRTPSRLPPCPACLRLLCSNLRTTPRPHSSTTCCPCPSGRSASPRCCVACKPRRAWTQTLQASALAAPPSSGSAAATAAGKCALATQPSSGSAAATAAGKCALAAQPSSRTAAGTAAFLRVSCRDNCRRALRPPCAHVHACACGCSRACKAPSSYLPVPPTL